LAKQTRYDLNQVKPGHVLLRMLFGEADHPLSSC
jgi:hypothetical protein